MNMEILEEQLLREILCTERPELESHWQDLRIRFLDAWEAVQAAEVLEGVQSAGWDELCRGPGTGVEMSAADWELRGKAPDPRNRRLFAGAAADETAAPEPRASETSQVPARRGEGPGRAVSAACPFRGVRRAEDAGGGIVGTLSACGLAWNGHYKGS